MKIMNAPLDDDFCRPFDDESAADVSWPGEALTENIDIELLMCILNFSEALYLCVTLSSSSDLIFSSEVSESVL